MKTITSLIAEAETKKLMWDEIANDPVALVDRNKSREEALSRMNYFEGMVDGYVEARRILTQ